MSTTICRQCGSERESERGRCAGCGAFIDATGGVQAHRRETLAESVSLSWFDWIGEILGIALIGGIAADLIPAWTIVIASCWSPGRSSASRYGWRHVGSTALRTSARGGLSRPSS